MNDFAGLNIAAFEDTDPSLGKPPPLYLEAVQKIGAALGLDADSIVAGLPITINGTVFWLIHHGQLDPVGMTMVIEMGNVPAALEVHVLKQLLEHNGRTPAAVAGYFSLKPGTSVAVYCVRLNLEKAVNIVDAVTSYVATVADYLRQGDQASAELLRELAGSPRDSAAAAFR